VGAGEPSENTTHAPGIERPVVIVTADGGMQLRGASYRPEGSGFLGPVYQLT